MITLTDRAAEHVRRHLGQQDTPADADLRIGVKSTGCSGYMYVVEASPTVGTDDEVFESGGIRIVVDRLSLGLLEGTELDYTREGLNEGFRFNNPNVSQTCGCGESFSV